MNDKELSVHARKLHLAQTKAAKERNPEKCACMLHEQKVRVATASLGVKNINLSQHGTVHLSSCKHSEMERTCWTKDKPKTKKRQRLVVEVE